MGNVIISPHPVKTKQRIDFNGNVIDERTKQIITPAEIVTPPIETPPQPVIAPTASVSEKVEGLSILEQIEETKRKLAELEELKKSEIEKKKKELELLLQ